MNWEEAKQKISEISEFPSFELHELPLPRFTGERHGGGENAHSLEHYTVGKEAIKNKLGTDLGFDCDAHWTICPKCSRTIWKSIVIYNKVGNTSYSKKF